MKTTSIKFSENNQLFSSLYRSEWQNRRVFLMDYKKKGQEVELTVRVENFFEHFLTNLFEGYLKFFGYGSFYKRESQEQLNLLSKLTNLEEKGPLTEKVIQCFSNRLDHNRLNGFNHVFLEAIKADDIRTFNYFFYQNTDEDNEDISRVSRYVKNTILKLVEHGSFKILKFLIRFYRHQLYFTHVESRCYESNDSLFLQPVKKNSVEIVKLLIDQCVDVKLSEVFLARRGKSIIYEAIKNHSKSILQLFIDHQLDFDRTEKILLSQSKSLFKPALKDPALFQLLIDAGVDLAETERQLSASGDSLLLQALEDGQLDIIQQFIDSGVDLQEIENNCLKNKKSLLLKAVENCNFEAVNLLIDAGIDAKKTELALGKFSQSLMIEVMENIEEHYLTEKGYRSLDILRLLVEKKIGIQKKFYLAKDHSISLLEFVIRYRINDLIEPLIRFGLNPDEEILHYTTLLHMAIRKMNTTAAIALIDLGSRLDREDGTEKTVLELALLLDQRDVAIHIINKDAYLLHDRTLALIHRLDDKDHTLLQLLFKNVFNSYPFLQTSFHELEEFSVRGVERLIFSHLSSAIDKGYNPLKIAALFDSSLFMQKVINHLHEDIRIKEWIEQLMTDETFNWTSFYQFSKLACSKQINTEKKQLLKPLESASLSDIDELFTSTIARTLKFAIAADEILEDYLLNLLPIFKKNREKQRDFARQIEKQFDVEKVIYSFYEETNIGVFRLQQLAKSVDFNQIARKRGFSTSYLKTGFQQFIERNYKKKPFLGTPKAGSQELLDYYAIIDKKLAYIIYKLEQEKDQAQIDGVIADIAIGGNFCGGRYMGEVTQIYNILQEEAFDSGLKKHLIKMTNLLKQKAVDAIAERYIKENHIDKRMHVHVYNHLRYLLRKELNQEFFEDPFGDSFRIDVDQVKKEFFSHLSVDRVLEEADQALFFNKDLKDLLIDWFKDYRSEAFKQTKLLELQQALKKSFNSGDTRDQINKKFQEEGIYLSKSETFSLDVLMRKAKSCIDYEYLEEYVFTLEGKFSQKAKLYLLQRLGIINPIQQFDHYQFFTSTQSSFIEMVQDWTIDLLKRFQVSFFG